MLILAVDGLAVNGALPLYIVSKSVLRTPCSVKKCLLSSVQKCLIDALSVLFQVELTWERLPVDGSGRFTSSLQLLSSDRAPQPRRPCFHSIARPCLLRYTVDRDLG